MSSTIINKEKDDDENHVETSKEDLRTQKMQTKKMMKKIMKGAQCAVINK